MSDNPGLYSLTHPAILAFPTLFEPKSFNGKGDAKYSAKFLFAKDHPDLAGLKQVMAKVARAKWPSRKFDSLSFPWDDGDTLADERKEKKGKDDLEFYRGKVVIGARSKFEPSLSAIVNGKLVEFEGPARIANKNLFFFGVEVLAQFNFVPYESAGFGDGVTAYCNKILSTGKGTKIGGMAQSAAEAFAGYVGKVSAVDPRGSAVLADEEIPF